MFLLEIFTPTPLNILSPQSSKKKLPGKALSGPSSCDAGSSAGASSMGSGSVAGKEGGGQKKGGYAETKRDLTHALSNHIPTIEFAPALYMDEMAQRSLEFPLEFF